MFLSENRGKLVEFLAATSRKTVDINKETVKEIIKEVLEADYKKTAQRSVYEKRSF